MQHNLKELEHRAFRVTFQDGLWDIYLGMILIGFGSMPLLRNGVSATVSIVGYSTLLVLAMTMLILGKQQITMPRLGYVRYSAERQRKISRAHLLLSGSIIAVVIVFGLILTNTVGLIGFSVLLGGIILVIFGGLAYLLDYHRLVIYAVLCAVSLPVGMALENEGILLDAPTAFIPVGLLAMVIGVVLLKRFVHHYHLPPADGVNG